MATVFEGNGKLTCHNHHQRQSLEYFSSSGTTTVTRYVIMSFIDKLKSTGIYFLTILNVVMLLVIFRESDIFVSQSLSSAKMGIHPRGRTDMSTLDDEERTKVYPYFSLEQSENYEKLKNMTYDVAEKIIITEKVEIVVYDISKPVPQESDNIECILLKNANPSYNICLHSNEQDQYLSKGLRTSFVWEGGLQEMIKSLFMDYPNATFLDLGSNIGVHSLFAAGLNDSIQVLAVEPFPKNVLRIHKAAHLNNVQNRVKVVMAPISDKRGDVTFYEIDRNIGGNGIVVKPSEVGRKGFTSKSILFDDILPLVKHNVAFMKMDIEAAECHVFSNAHKLFDKIDIKFIIMEILYTKREGQCCFERMLSFMKEKNYKAFPFPYQRDNKIPLDYASWQSWTHGEVYFKKFYNITQ